MIPIDMHCRYNIISISIITDNPSQSVRPIISCQFNWSGVMGLAFFRVVAAGANGRACLGLGWVLRGVASS